MKKLSALLLFITVLFNTYAQSKTDNLVIVTLDGLRWQEVFKGVDSAIIANKKFTSDSEQVIKNFWSADAEGRRQKLFPFLWNTVARHGQLHGNRTKGSKVNNANPYWFSYPGYNEIFTGYPDTAVNSNDKIANKNENVLEFINRQKGYNGKVAAFATWDVFPYILNSERSKVYVNAGVDSFHFTSPSFKLLNDMQFLSAKPIDVRLDVNTYLAARTYLQEHKPKVLYIAFDETDDFAHSGMYDQYLKSAHAEDAMIADLWQTIQSMPGYKNNTTLIITCDHGRGDAVKEEWTSHGDKIQDAGQIWFAAIGPHIKPTGEAATDELFYQAQLATTMAALLGLEFKPAHPVMQPLQTLLK
ncbi:alkaline phosphatase family protein [Panacibacter sp. DH6]|uniref:Alkaline phosphatase family protein n=1 Tax=Panacibacter microcysteis TaxID=2793269 RepID=A0A931H0H0_9BACT|nr:alkaline phosphatase family protein [Panacibacter microcysteis]MBG9378724.1 alkaline phosphatase family protein [Panacibacter microcysteis]